MSNQTSQLPSNNEPFVIQTGQGNYKVNPTWYKFLYNFARVSLSGAASGDITGIYPALTVSAINGATLGTTTATNGNVLVANGSSWRSEPVSGDVTISNTGVVTLANSGVTAASYGSATQVPSYTVDAKGRITSASNVAISGIAPSGAAGGDLSGTYPNPTVSKINGLTPAASATTDTTNAANISSGTLSAGRLPNPSASTLGGIESYAAVSNQWINSISTLGVPSSTQPAFSNLNGNIATSQMNSGTSASSSTFFRGDGTWATPSGTSFVVQRVSTIVSTVATGTTAIPLDNTIPQNTEGDQYMSLAITPTNSANKLVIEAWGVWSHSTGNTRVIAALFQDTTANALAATMALQATGTGEVHLYMKWPMTAGTTSATTFKVRAGGGSTGATTTFNGSGGSQWLGGTLSSGIMITEYTS